MTSRLSLPAAPRILIVALRRLGDVLLTTPLIRSVRAAWPDARIEVLVFRDTAAILQGNPDIDAVITCPERPSARDNAALARRLWRDYDLAISTQAGDRPSFFAILAGRTRIGLSEQRMIGRLKRLLLHRHLGMREDMHRVEETLQLAGLLGIVPVREVVVPREDAASACSDRPYAVLHAAPFFRYKQWHREGWRQLAEHLILLGLQVVATGGPAPAERAYLDEVWRGLSIERRDGALGWGTLTALLQGARVYVGPDTSVTHLAAAAGCPTVALFGPTDPVRWGPWPQHGLDTPWETSGHIQRRGNVWLVQNPLPGMPCRLEGCLRHINSHSLCLDFMPAESVLQAIDEALAGQGGAAAETPLFSVASPSTAP